MNAHRRWRPGESLLGALFGAATLALLLPWPRPSVSLRDVCELRPAGRLAAQCDLAAAADRSGAAWLRTGLRVFEDGLVLRAADRPGEVRNEQPGSYHTTGRLLTFSSLDGSDPAGNGREYRARPLEFDPLGLAAGPRRAVLAALLLLAFAGACWLRRARLEPFLGAATLAVALAGLALQVPAVVIGAPVHVDAGYALPAAESVANGGVPYRSLLFNYTPLGVFEIALWSRAWPGPDPPPHSWYLVLIVASEAVCALLVFLFSVRAGVRAGVAAPAALASLSMTLWFDGGRVLFEPLYLVPVLLAGVLALAPPAPRTGAGAGALAAVAFLTKQYGGYGLVGAAGSALLEPRGRLRQLLWLAAGFALVLCAALVLLLGLGVELRSLLAQTIGPDYPRRYESVWLRLFLLQCPPALIAVLVPFLPGAWERRGVRVAACFLLASCLPLYFRQHQYYFLNVCPWVFVLFALGVELLAERRPRLRPWALLLAGALLTSIPLRAASAQAASFVRSPRSDQLRRGRLMNLAWPAGRRTLMLLYPGFNHIGHYRSPDEARIGYRFPNELRADQLRLGFELAEGAWIDPRGMYARGADRVLREAGSSLEEQLARNGFEQRTLIEDRFELWVKRR